MLLLSSTADKIQVITSAATSVGVHASWVDLNGSTVTPDRANTTISSATTTDVVASPSSSTTRNVKFLSVFNDATTGTHTITVRHTDGTTSVDVWQGDIPAQSAVVFDEASGWTAVENAPATDVQTFDAPGGVWVKPSNLPTGLTLVRIWGGGGGGGGGSSSAAVAIAKGGAGGGGSACISQVFPTRELPDEVRVIVGYGGSGGVGAAAGGAGASGGPGQNSRFYSLISFGGISGAGGVTGVASTAGGSGTGVHNLVGNLASGSAAAMIGINGPSGTVVGPTWEGGGPGGGSSNSTTIPAMISGANSRWGAGGGGAGGCHTSTLGVTQPSAGGGTGNSVGGTAGGSGGAAGTSGTTPTAGGNGTDSDGISGGHGGGGGGTTVAASTSGAAGGNGGKGGGGGGGGGCGMDPGLGGAGGNGGNGYAVIISW